MEDKPSEWAMRTAERVELFYLERTDCLTFWGKQPSTEDLARIIDEEFQKWMKEQDPQKWKNAGPFPV